MEMGVIEWGLVLLHVVGLTYVAISEKRDMDKQEDIKRQRKLKREERAERKQMIEFEEYNNYRQAQRTLTPVDKLGTTFEVRDTAGTHFTAPVTRIPIQVEVRSNGIVY